MTYFSTDGKVIKKIFNDVHEILDFVAVVEGNFHAEKLGSFSEEWGRE